mgnify:CR=1 FL=1|tara:strand:- start:82 stop:975 length:894 start_codon:yes stop_codon:yes gene_type:complete
MRNRLVELIGNDFIKQNYFLTADLGFSVVERLKRISSKRFLNVGVAENNMLTLAIGISENLKKNEYVFCYSISPFIILRSLELIRNYLNYENRKIRIIGVGSGLSYSFLGKTHFLMEDLNILNGFKNLIILNPGNEIELNYVYKKFKNYNGPVYFRINKSQPIDTKGFVFKKKDSFFIKRGTGSNIIVSGKIYEFLNQNLTYDEIRKLNIISIPIFNYEYCKNVYKFINKNQKTLCLVDNKQTLLFEKIKYHIRLITNKSVWNLDLDPTHITDTGDEFEMLKQSGFSIRKIKNFILK